MRRLSGFENFCLWASLLLGAPAFAAPSELDRFEPTIATCAKRADNKKYAVFHGCWDWHSAVHAHWALFRIARARGVDSPATTWAEASLSPAGLAKELRRLQAHADFENPYGRAWFLRLAIDFEKWGEGRRVRAPLRLRQIADLVAQSLLAAYAQTPPDPDSGEYDNASWAFTQLHLYYAHTGDAKAQAQVDAIIAAHFVRGDEKLSFEHDGKEFFSRFGNWAYLVARTMTPARLGEFLAAYPLPADLGPRPVVEGYAHSLSVNWSRVWAFKALRARIADESTRARLDAAITAGIAGGVAIHERFKNDYQAYGHWVSQFAVYALTEGALAD